MKRDYPHLCAPLTVGRLTLRNRMLSAPMGATDITAEGTPGPRTQGFYELRAKGGAAVVTVSELVVHPETDGSQMLRLSLKTPGQLGAFTYLADAIKRHGAVASIELSHSGQYAGTYMVDKEKKGDLCQWGPSDGVRPDGMPVRALSHEQIASIVAAYGEAAALAKRAGFQMVMVHAGHGWLINQFLSPYFNKREDEYGGPLENRIRFAREVLASVRSAVGPGFPIELRISGAELFEGGYVGAGSITCNYDGAKKWPTTIGDGAFIGSDTMMVAPVNVGAHTLVAAGSVITKDVPDGALAIARGRQENHEGWVEKHHPSN